MASSSYAVTLPVGTDVVLDPLTGIDDETLAALAEACGADHVGYTASRRYRIQLTIHDFCAEHGVDGLEYVNRAQTLLDEPGIDRAIAGLSKLLWFFENRAEDAAAFLQGELFSGEVREASRLDLDELDRVCDPDGENFYCVLLFIRDQLARLRQARQDGRHVLHVLYDSAAWEDYLRERAAPPRAYAKTMLCEIEALLARGPDRSALPVAPPAPRSMIYGQARDWYLAMLDQLPKWTNDPAARVRLMRELRIAAIASLIEPHAAPRFFTEFPLPDGG